MSAMQYLGGEWGMGWAVECQHGNHVYVASGLGRVFIQATNISSGVP